MGDDASAETNQKKRKPTNLVGWFTGAGWVLGLGFSLLLPQLTAPLEATLPYKLVGFLSAITGFGLAYKMTPRLATNRKIVWSIVPLIGAVVAGGIYRSLLLSAEHTTPSVTVEWVEFVLFCLAYFCVFALISSAYRNGGAVIIQKFTKITVPTN